MNGGRACWAVAGTFCNGKIQGTYARKLYDCTRCEFYRLVWDEEGEHYSGAGEILARLYPV